MNRVVISFSNYSMKLQCSNRSVIRSENYTEQNQEFLKNVGNIFMWDGYFAELQKLL